MEDCDKDVFEPAGCCTLEGGGRGRVGRTTVKPLSPYAVRTAYVRQFLLPHPQTYTLHTLMVFSSRDQVKFDVMTKANMSMSYINVNINITVRVSLRTHSAESSKIP